MHLIAAYLGVVVWLLVAEDVGDVDAEDDCDVVSVVVVVGVDVNVVVVSVVVCVVDVGVVEGVVVVSVVVAVDVAVVEVVKDVVADDVPVDVIVDVNDVVGVETRQPSNAPALKASVMMLTVSSVLAQSLCMKSLLPKAQVISGKSYCCCTSSRNSRTTFVSN